MVLDILQARCPNIQNMIISGMGSSQTPWNYRLHRWLDAQPVLRSKPGHCNQVENGTSISYTNRFIDRSHSAKDWLNHQDGLDLLDIIVELNRATGIRTKRVRHWYII